MELLDMWKKAGKYNWRRIINHVNSKRRSIGKLQTKTPKGPNIVLGDDASIQRETDFGFIRMTINDNNQDEINWAEEFTCCKCGETFQNKGGIIRHISWKHRELEK